MTSTLTGTFPGPEMRPASRQARAAMAARVSAAAVSSAAGAALAAEEVTPMLGARFPVEVVGGVPVVAAPQEIDITNADGLRSALLEVAAHGHGTLVADMTRTGFVIRPGFMPCSRRTSVPRRKAVSCCWSSPPLPSCAFSRSRASTA